MPFGSVGDSVKGRLSTQRHVPHTGGRHGHLSTSAVAPRVLATSTFHAEPISSIAMPIDEGPIRRGDFSTGSRRPNSRAALRRRGPVRWASWNWMKSRRSLSSGWCFGKASSAHAQNKPSDETAAGRGLSPSGRFILNHSGSANVGTPTHEAEDDPRWLRTIGQDMRRHRSHALPLPPLSRAAFCCRARSFFD
jgi:hypothetical protein